jgi:hypothetical protein
MANANVLLCALISIVVLEQTLVLATFDTDTTCVWGKDNCQINGDNLTLILNQWSGMTISEITLDSVIYDGTFTYIISPIYVSLNSGVIFSGASVTGTKEFLFGYVNM